MNLARELKQIRNELLSKNNISLCKRINDFLSVPDQKEISVICGEAQNALLANKIEPVLIELINMYENDKSRYRDEISFGQAVIWSEIIKATNELCFIKSTIGDKHIVYYDTDYLRAIQMVKSVFDLYSSARACLTNLENALGIDRYLDRINYDDFEVLSAIMDEIRNSSELLLKQYKSTFILKWNSTTIYSIILHKLMICDEANEICGLFKSNQKKVIVLLVDGFGYGQYCWNQKVIETRQSYTFNESFLNWLEKEKLSKNNILASSLITDTSAGLSQIFSGQTPAETGIIASKYSLKNPVKLKETKKIERLEFTKTFQQKQCNIATSIANSGLKTKIYYCSKYDSEEKGFSGFIFKDAKVHSITPQERVFSVLFDDLKQNKLGLDIVYFTGLDNTSHTMGAYSQFERYEHEKFNRLFKNFVIQLAIDEPNMFDGNTSIIITADHGMSESENKMISRFDILKVLRAKSVNNVTIIENNRALLIYNISDELIDMAQKAINDFMNEIQVECDILSNNDELYIKCLPSNEDKKLSRVRPDIIVQLRSNGLFYSGGTLSNLNHFGGHGGSSIDEVFIPLVVIDLNNKLLEKINDRFVKLI